MSQDQSVDISSVYVDYVVNSIFDEHSKGLFLKIASAFDNCFLLAKENKFVEAEIQMKEGEQYQTLVDINVQPWINSFLGQRVAYFYYKIGDFDNAICVSNKVIGSSKKLVENGYQFVFFSAIQQMFNISRIFFAKNDISTALTYSRNAIKLMIIQSSNWKTELFVNTSSFSEKELILAIQYQMIYSVIAESYAKAIKVFGLNCVNAQNLLREFTNSMTKLDLEISIGDTRYKDLITFFQIAEGFWTKGTDVIDEFGAAFLQAKHADKRLLKILFELANSIKLSTQPQ